MKSLTKLFLGLGGLAAVCGGVTAATIGFENRNTVKTNAVAANTYADCVRIYLSYGSWSGSSSPKASGTDSNYIDMVDCSIGTSTIANFVSSNGDAVADLYQPTATVSGTSFMHLYFMQGSYYIHPYDGSNQWNTGYNNLYLSAAVGGVYKISITTYQEGKDNDKWANYTVTTLGQLLHFDAQTGGVLPTGQSATIEVDGTTATLPAACTRSANDGYAFENWTYGGVKYDAGASITISTANLAAYANYTVTADSFSSWILDDTERNKETCATKFAMGKTLYNTMSMAEQAKINPSTYGAAYSRWTAWQAANGEIVPQKTSAAVVSKSSDKTATAVIAGLAVISVAAAGGYFFIRKKHVA